MMIIDNRIPYEYFVTNGSGESNYGSEGLPYETGSYDEALTNAGIQNTNILEYTSIIPPIAKEISREEGIQRIRWGEVMECIKAETNGEKGKYISAAVMTTTVYSPDGEYLGGIACEYSGSGTRREAEKSLEGSIEGIIERRNFGKVIGNVSLYKNNITDKGYTIFPGKIFVYDGLHVKKRHGTVIACICFVSYKINVSAKNKNKTVKKNKMKQNNRNGKLNNKKKKTRINLKKNKYYYYHK
jgi:pyruvoyl-dependent arginine decarboxylase